MLAIVLTMLAIVVVAGLVLVYVAFPHRGEQVPAAPWLGDAMAKAVDAAPTLAEDERDETDAQTDAQADSQADSQAGHAPLHRR